MRIPAPICAEDTMRDLGALTINSVLMHIDGCWNVLNPQILWFYTDDRGSNVVISKSTGRRGYSWRYDEGTYSMQIIIDGVNDWEGDPYDNPFEGIETNVEYLHDTVFLPIQAENASYPATLLMPSGITRVASVQPRILQGVPDMSNGCAATTFTLKVLEGRFEPETS